MNPFKVGDIVVSKDTPLFIMEVTSVSGCDIGVKPRYDKGCAIGYKGPYIAQNCNYYKLLISSQMSLRETAVLLFKKEPEKSFIKAGIIDSSEIPTDDGVKLFVAWALKQKSLGDMFKNDIVDAIIESQNKTK